MSASDPIETGRDRAALTREAGIGKLSFLSVLAGVLVAYGAFAVLAALAAAAAAAIGLNTDLSANNWAGDRNQEARRGVLAGGGADPRLGLRVGRYR